MREETYIERGKGPPPRDLVFHGREDSIEDIPRDFPPPGRSRRNQYDDDPPPRRARSVGARSRYDDDESEDGRYTEYGGAGAAGYAAGRNAGRRDRRRREDRDYDSDNSDSPPRRERKKSGITEALEGLGLGGVAGALLGGNKKDRSRSGSRGARSTRSRSRGPGSRRYSSDEETARSRSRGPGGDKRKTERKWAQAAQAALVAGAVEAFLARKEPGPWTGQKGKRIATAAIGAGGIDGLLDRDPDKKSKRHLAEAVIGGLAANRLANGARSKSRGPARDASYSPDSRAPRSRSRSIIDRLRGRSQSGGPGDRSGTKGGASGAITGLLAGGTAAAAGKAIYDRVRSKSRKRRSPSSSSADSYVPSRNRRRRNRRRSPESDSRRSVGPATDRGRGPDTRGKSNDNDNGIGASRELTKGGASGAVAAQGGEKKEGDGNSSSSCTTDIEKKRKKMRGKELITAGLATIATIHAAHGVYSSMEAHEKRHRLVAEGEMSPEEARKKQTKAWVQDAAAVGIAALGIKGAFSEWKEMNEQRYVVTLAVFAIW